MLNIPEEIVLCLQCSCLRVRNFEDYNFLEIVCQDKVLNDAY